MLEHLFWVVYGFLMPTHRVKYPFLFGYFAIYRYIRSGDADRAISFTAGKTNGLIAPDQGVADAYSELIRYVRRKAKSSTTVIGIENHVISVFEKRAKKWKPSSEAGQ